MSYKRFGRWKSKSQHSPQEFGVGNKALLHFTRIATFLLICWLAGGRTWASTLPAPAGSSDSVSLTSGPSACSAPRQRAPVSLVKWPHPRSWKFGGKERLTRVPVLPCGFSLSFTGSSFSLLFQLHVHPSLLSACHVHSRL